MPCWRSWVPLEPSLGPSSESSGLSLPCTWQENTKDTCHRKGTPKEGTCPSALLGSEEQEKESSYGAQGDKKGDACRWQRRGRGPAGLTSERTG